MYVTSFLGLVLSILVFCPVLSYIFCTSVKESRIAVATTSSCIVFVCVSVDFLYLVCCMSYSTIPYHTFPRECVYVNQWLSFKPLRYSLYGADCSLHLVVNFSVLWYKVRMILLKMNF